MILFQKITKEALIRLVLFNGTNMQAAARLYKYHRWIFSSNFSYRCAKYFFCERKHQLSTQAAIDVMTEFEEYK